LATEEARLAALSNIYKNEFNRYLEHERKKTVQQAKKLNVVSRNERKRALVRMLRYNDEINQAVIGHDLKHKAREELLISRLLNEVQNLERKSIIETKRAERENDRDIQKKLDEQKDSLEN
jgi:hypothetical protein